MQMCKLKVAHITTVDSSLRYLLINQLLFLREKYSVIGISSAGRDVEFLESTGIKHISIRITRSLTPLSDLITLIQLYKIIRRERFDIVHTHTPKPGLLGQLAAKLARTPIVVNTIHGFYFHDDMNKLWRSFYIFMERIAARCSDAILSQNSEDVSTALKENICPEGKIEYLGNGIDIRHFDRGRLSLQIIEAKKRELGLLDVPVVGFVGRLVVEKGLLVLMKAALIVIDQIPNVKFLVVGPTDEEKNDAIRPDIVEQYGVEDYFIFLGQRHDMPELYALMNVLVLPSYREGFPRAPMEASAMAVPSIVSNIRGCRETVLDYETGLFVPVGDHVSLAKAIIFLLNDPITARKMGDKARSLAVKKFDEQKVFTRVDQKYLELIKKKINHKNLSRS
jgi:glycosyltransferase involved in cell wall biosynthesis